MEFFDSWRPVRGQCTVESDWTRFCPYNPRSLDLLLPSSKSPTETVTLPLFGAASASTTGTGLPAAAAAGSSSSAPSSSGLTATEARDVVQHAGGPVWGLDWCPAGTAAPGDVVSGPGGSSGRAPAAAAAVPSAHDYLAVSCHPPEAAHHVIGTTVQGPACIQVWELSHPMQQAAGQQQQQQAAAGGKQQQQRPGYRLPRMALALAHNGGLAWHCQWCPSAALADTPAWESGRGSRGRSSGVLPRLGLLAAALGDGSVRVWPVPHPHAAAQQQQQQQGAAGAAAAPLVLSVPPVVVVSSAALGGSLPSVVDWLPAPPHDLLAVGCWDGTVAVLKLAPGEQQQQQQQQGGAGEGGADEGGQAHYLLGAQLLCHFSADVLPLRTLRWMPPCAAAAAVDVLHRNVFLTGGNEGALRLWDLRDPFQPLYSHVLSSNSVILAADWTAAPLGIVAALEDGSLRGVTLDSGIIEVSTSFERKAMFSISWRGGDMGAMWGLAVQPSMQLVAYGGEDGVVGAFHAEYEGHAKRRQPHAAMSGWRLEGVALALRMPAQLEREARLFDQKVMERNAENLSKARLPEEAEAVHRVAWSRHGGGSGAWLASAGAAGVVRCQWIQTN